jgi:hypothetical protein
MDRYLIGRSQEAVFTWWKAHSRMMSDLFLKTGIDNVSINTAEDYVRPLIKTF